MSNPIDVIGTIVCASDYGKNTGDILKSYERTWITRISEIFHMVEPMDIVLDSENEKVLKKTTIDRNKAVAFLQKVDPKVNINDPEEVKNSIMKHYKEHLDEQKIDSERNVLSEMSSLLTENDHIPITINKDQLTNFLYKIMNASKPPSGKDKFIESSMEQLGLKGEGPFTIDQEKLRKFIFQTNFKSDDELKQQNVRVPAKIIEIANWKNADEDLKVLNAIADEWNNDDYDSFPALKAELNSLLEQAFTEFNESKKENYEIDVHYIPDLSVRLDAIRTRKDDVMEAHVDHENDIFEGKSFGERYGSTLGNNGSTLGNKEILPTDTPEDLFVRLKSRKKDKNLEEFCKTLAKSDSDHVLIDGRPHKITSIIAKALYLIDNIDNTNFKLNPLLRDRDSKILFIESAFKDEMTKIHQKLQGIKDNYELNVLTMSSGKLAGNLQLSIELAEILIDSQGQLNRSLIDDVLKQLFPKVKGEKRSELEKHIRSMLGQYENFSEINTALSSIRKPDENNEIGKEIIRNALNLDIDEVITDRHARIVAFAATVSMWRQGSVYSCYATAFLDQMLVLSPEKLLTDFKDILKEGFIKRDVDGYPMRFVASTIASQESPIRRTLRMDVKGNSYNSLGEHTSFLPENPTIIKACKALKIPENEVAAVIQEAIKSLSKDTKRKDDKGNFQITIEELFTEIAKTKSDDDASKTKKLLDKALFAYQSAYQSPLLRATENALGSMDLTGTGYLQGLLQASFETTISEQLEIQPKSVDQQKFALFLNNFFEEEGQRFQFHFSPDIEFEKVEKDKDVKYYNSGFVLYEVDPAKRTTNSDAYTLITTEEQFQGLFRKILQDFASYAKRMKDHQLSGELDNLLRTNDPPTQLTKKFLTYYEQNTHNNTRIKQGDVVTPPWKTEKGGQSEEIFPTYWGSEKGIKEGTVIPATKKKDRTTEKDPTEAQMTEVMSQCFDLTSQIDSPDKRMRLCLATANHSFNLLPAHKSITKRLSDYEKPGQNKVTPEAFVQQFLEEGKELANEKLDDTSINNIKAYVIENCNLTKTERANFEKIIAEIKKPHKIKDYINKIRNAVITVVEKGQKKLIREESFFREILPHLSKEILKKIKEKSVFFADSNWAGDDGRSMYFAYIVNPISQKLDVVLFDDAGETIQTYYTLKDKELTLFTLDEATLKSYDKTASNWAKELETLKEELSTIEADCAGLSKELSKELSELPKTHKSAPAFKLEKDYLKKVDEYHALIKQIKAHYKKRPSLEKK